MEKHNIDSIIKKAINESENFYDEEANNAKERIWEQVQVQEQSQTKPLLLRLLVAACILLFISTIVITISNIKARNTISILSELNSDLKNKAKADRENALINKEALLAVTANSSDTVFIEKEVIITKPIVTTIKTTDTVFIQQLVYVEKEQNPELLASLEKSDTTESTSQIFVSNYETEILISNKEPLIKEKKKKMKIKFGGPKNQSNSGTLAFSKKL